MYAVSRSVYDSQDGVAGWGSDNSQQQLEELRQSPFFPLGLLFLTLHCCLSFMSCSVYDSQDGVVCWGSDNSQQQLNVPQKVQTSGHCCWPQQRSLALLVHLTNLYYKCVCIVRLCVAACMTPMTVSSAGAQKTLSSS
jgi:hypothetical protein